MSERWWLRLQNLLLLIVVETSRLVHGVIHMGIAGVNEWQRRASAKYVVIHTAIKIL
jgi:hypothetical protein